MWHVWERGEVHTGFWWEHLREIDHYEGVGLDIKIDLQEIGWGVRIWIDLAQDKARLRALLRAVVNFRVP
jgi:hypothetical protein